MATKGGAGGPLLRALVLLALALLFFAIRQFLVMTLQTFPVPGVRDRLVARQTHRRRRAQVELEEALTRRTAAGWPGRGFAKPFVYPNVAVLSPGEAVLSSVRTPRSRSGMPGSTLWGAETRIRAMIPHVREAIAEH